MKYCRALNAHQTTKIMQKKAANRKLLKMLRGTNTESPRDSARRSQKTKAVSITMDRANNVGMYASFQLLRVC